MENVQVSGRKPSTHFVRTILLAATAVITLTACQGDKDSDGATLADPGVEDSVLRKGSTSQCPELPGKFICEVPEQMKSQEGESDRNFFAKLDRNSDGAKVLVLNETQDPEGLRKYIADGEIHQDAESGVAFKYSVNCTERRVGLHRVTDDKKQWIRAAYTKGMDGTWLIALYGETNDGKVQKSRRCSAAPVEAK